MFSKIYIYIPKKEMKKKKGIGYLKNLLFTKFSKSKKVIISNVINDDSNCIYIFLRWFKNEYIEKINELKTKGNYFIYQILDQNYKNNINIYKQKLEYLSTIFDHIIFNSKHHQNLFNLNINTSFSFHEFDIRFKSNKVIDCVEYHGMTEKTSFNNSILEKFNIKQFTYSKSLEKISGYSCIHVDYITNENQYYHYHTSTKLSTALVLNCIFLCNRVPVYTEILGQNYKFYINDDLSNLKELISLAKETINNKSKYKEYLDSVKKYKEQLSPENINKEYMKIFESIKKKN